MNLADANGLLMVVAKFVLWPKKDNKNVLLFIVCLSNSKVSTSLPRLQLMQTVTKWIIIQ